MYCTRLDHTIWGFPKIGAPPNHPFQIGMFPYKQSILRYPYLWKPPYESLAIPAWQGLLLNILCSFGASLSQKSSQVAWQSSVKCFMVTSAGTFCSLSVPSRRSDAAFKIHKPPILENVSPHDLCHGLLENSPTIVR